MDNLINQNKIESIPVVMLGSFGHAGIDWVHSLLDNHDEILIMPAFSFFRSIDRVEFNTDLNFDDSDNKSTTKAISSLFLHDNAYQLKRRKIIDKNNLVEFEKNLFFYLNNSLEKNKKKKLFFGIHYAYSKIYGIDLNKKKLIVSHEHLSWHSKKYLEYFNSKFLFIFRDPRAVLGGGILRMQNSNSDKIINAFQYDTMILDMLTAFKFFLKNKDISYHLLNETMHLDLKKEMMKLARLLNINFSFSMLEQTFLGQEWKGESSYLAKDELENSPPNDYYFPKNVEKRWRSILSDEEILIIEVVFEKMMKEFNFKFDNKLSLMKKVKGYFLFFTKYQHQQKYFFNKHIIILRNILRRLVILFSEKQFKTLFKFK